MIKTFIICEICSELLIKPIVLEKNYLEYSFTKFLSHCFMNETFSNKNFDNNDDNKRNCFHENIVRVFEVGEIFVKVFFNIFIKKLI